MEDHQSLLIVNARIITPAGAWLHGWLRVEAGQIRGMGEGDPPVIGSGETMRKFDASGCTLLPGFIDLHAHGAMGFEAMDSETAGLREMARFYARHGVTAFLPTTWTANREKTLAALEAIRKEMGPIEGGATILGAHMEGPYLNPVKTGAHEVDQVRRVERGEALAFLETGAVKRITLAPEFAENLWLIEECARRGIAVSAGHTNAHLEELRRAVALGLNQVTHCFNAMDGLHHRTLGTVGAAMALPEIRCELIADNVHVHPAAQAILIRAKGPEGILLVTDALRPAGLPQGEYNLDGRPITVDHDQVRLLNGVLAGSVLTMERALQNALHNSGVPLEQGWVMSSHNAAHAIGIEDRKGSLEPGKDADLVLLDENGEVRMTIAEGRVVYENASRSGPSPAL